MVGSYFGCRVFRRVMHASFALLALCIAMLGEQVHAGKILRYYSTAGDTAIYAVGGSFGNATPGSDAKLRMPRQPDGWLEIEVPAATPSAGYSNIGFSQKDWRNQTGRIDLTAAFASGDTAWVIPNPFPTGKSGLKVLTSAPRSRIVLFWNPWLNPFATPWMHVEGGAGVKMAASSSHTGWYEARAMGYSTLQLLFTDSASTRSMGAAGEGVPVAFVVDSVAQSSDTVWIRGTPEGGATGVKVTARQPASKLLMIYNPWTGRLPIQRPLVMLGGNGPFKPDPDPEYCGWYRFAYFDRAPSLVLRSSRPDAVRKDSLWGAGGFRSDEAIDLSGAGDTAWVSMRPDSLPRVTASATSDRGLCDATLLAATIRDFAADRAPTDPYFNREFKEKDKARGCWQGGWSVVKGMVDSVLGADRKPVRSAHDTGAKYPNDWTYAFRCTYDTAKPATKAEIGDSGISTNWFRTVKEKNAETCRDIPLVLNDTTGAYEYDNQKFFPIDDFKTLSDGSPNPFYDTIAENVYDPGGPRHNYGFCLESHGTFEYKKGQVFRFRGDDDVWFYIDNKLMVDLGGIHGPTSDSVQLDSIGAIRTPRLDANGNQVWANGKQLFDISWSQNRLIEGKAYNFDFFFCERHPAGSSMKIQTQMNLRTDARLQVMDTARGNGVTSYDIYVSTTSGQGCQARTQVARATGIVRLVDPSGTVRNLSTGLHFGGITVDSAAGNVRLDSAAITGLRPGRYAVQFVYLKDTTVVRDYYFTVPWTAGPRYVVGTKVPVTGVVGSSFRVTVSSYNSKGPDSSSIAFVPHPVKGLEFYRDSLLTDRIADGDTLRTGVNTVARTYWAKGTVPGTYSMSIGAFAGDTADTWSDIVVLDKGIRFLDAQGNVLPADSLPIEAMLGDTVRVWFETFAGTDPCTTCGSRVAIVPSSPFLQVSADTVVLVNGRGSVLVKGTGAVDGASLKLSVTTDSVMAGIRQPIAFRVKGPDSAFVSDRDGDGRADRFTVFLHHKWTAGSSLAFGWPDTALRVDAVTGKVTASLDSMSVQVDFDSGFAVATASSGSGKAGLYAWGTETPQTFRVTDRIAPVALSARLRYGRSGASDTLLVALSETVPPLVGNRALQLLGPSGWAATAQAGQDLSPSSDTLRLLFAAPTPLLCPVPGDSVRLFPAGDVSDAAGNVPGVSPRSVVVQGGPRPPSVGWLQDRDGDGKVETAVARFARPVRGTLPTLSVSVGDGRTVQARTGSVLHDPSDSSLLVLTFSEPLPFGWTAFLPTAQGLMDGDWAFPLRDSAAPTVRSAVLRLTESYSDPDTLMVVASEALGLDATRSWLQLLQRGATYDLPALSQVRRGDTLLWLMMPEDPIGVRAGDSVRFSPSGSVADTFGNVPASFAIWHRVTGGTRKPVAQLIQPIPLVRLPSGQATVQTSALALQATRGDTSSWSSWNPRGGYGTDPVCPRGICNGPELVLNSPVGIGLHIYDQLGTHVASGSWDIDSSALESMVRDRLGRTRVRISWNHRTASGARAADGVYLLRMVMMVPVDGSVERKVVNTLWKIGLGPEEKK